MGERSIQEKYQAWRKCPGMNEELHNQLKAMSPDELNDSFYRSLAFGTGGLRGILGAGENRMNLYTVSKAGTLPAGDVREAVLRRQLRQPHP
mgnify:CR=1 FL=1